jgi:hypothetical protein
MAKQQCKHNHECETCVREEIKKVEAKLKELKAKLPQQITVICNHGCHGYCNHWNNTRLLGQVNVPYVQTLGMQGIVTGTLTTSGNSLNAQYLSTSAANSDNIAH